MAADKKKQLSDLLSIVHRAAAPHYSKIPKEDVNQAREIYSEEQFVQWCIYHFPQEVLKNTSYVKDTSDPRGQPVQREAGKKSQREEEPESNTTAARASNDNDNDVMNRGEGEDEPSVKEAMVSAISGGSAYLDLLRDIHSPAKNEQNTQAVHRRLQDELVKKGKVKYDVISVMPHNWTDDHSLTQVIAEIKEWIHKTELLYHTTMAISTKQGPQAVREFVRLQASLQEFVQEHYYAITAYLRELRDSKQEGTKSGLKFVECSVMFVAYHIKTKHPQRVHSTLLAEIEEKVSEDMRPTKAPAIYKNDFWIKLISEYELEQGKKNTSAHETSGVATAFSSIPKNANQNSSPTNTSRRH